MIKTNTEYLKGDYSDREVIDLLNDPKVKQYLEEGGVKTISQWKAVGKKIKSTLKHYTINEGALRKNILMWGARFSKGCSDG